VPWTRMPTVYAAARVLGLDATVARLLQAGVTAAVVIALCAIWRRRVPLAWRGSALAIALLLATPYAFDYDLVVLVLPIAWLFRDALRARASLVDETLLVAAWASPALFWVIAMAGGPPLMPVLLAVLLLMVWRRVFAPVPAPVAHTVEAA
jgi:alpha-1,2-mannosyltransferase